MYIDSHCHLDRLDPDKVGPLEEVLISARRRGVKGFLCIATHLDGYQKIRDIAQAHPDVRITAGVHPLHKNLENLEVQRLIEQVNDPLTLAVGETGLDYYYAKTEAQQEAQRDSFIEHIKVSVSSKKPLVIHTRDAVDDTMQLLSEYGAEQSGGVLHCFTEHRSMAEAAIEMGFYVSFSGILTFSSAESLRQTAASLPLERLLIETDCPWLAPVPYRGKENQPAYVVEVAQQLAELHQISVQELAQQTTANFYRCFNLKADDLSTIPA